MDIGNGGGGGRQRQSRELLSVGGRGKQREGIEKRKGLRTMEGNAPNFGIRAKIAFGIKLPSAYRRQCFWLYAPKFLLEIIILEKDDR